MGDQVAVEAALAAAPPAPMTFVAWPDRRIENLSSLLDALSARAGTDEKPRADGESGETPVRVGEVLAVVGRRAYGPLLLVIGLLSISPITIVPGMTWFFAAVTLLVAGQMMVGLKRPWLPKKVIDLNVPAPMMRKTIDAARPWASRIDRFLKPRLEFLANPPFANFVAALAVIAALVTFPLGLIPMAPMAPCIAVILIALGITARDGFVLLVGLVAVALAGWLSWSVVG